MGRCQADWIWRIDLAVFVKRRMLVVWHDVCSEAIDTSTMLMVFQVVFCSSCLVLLSSRSKQIF